MPSDPPTRLAAQPPPEVTPGMGAFGGFGAYVQSIFQDCPGKLRLAALIVSMAASDLLLGSLHFLGHQANPAWLANGIMLGVLLSCPLRQLGAYGLAGAMGFALWGFCVSLAPPLFLAAAAVKPLSITVAAVIVRRHLGRSTDLTRPGVMWQFIVVAVLAAPVLPSLTSTFIRSQLGQVEIVTILARTTLANALGTAIIAPFVVSLYRHELFEAFSPERRVKAAWALSGLIFGTGLVFSLTHYSFLFLIMPLLLVTVAQLTMLGASLGLMVILLISTVLTQQGLGPFLILPYSDEVRSILLQVFLITGCLMAYPVAAIISTQRALELGLIVRETRARFAEAKLRESERFHRHLSENASDIISRFSLDGRRLYVSPSAIDILGFTPAELLSHGWADRVHPDDRTSFQIAGEQMRAGEERIHSTYRYARSDGSWAWIEARLRLVRSSTGEPHEYISNARDITLQKEAQDALAVAMSELSVLATTDGLTGLANRRRFDETLRKEWRRAARSHEPLALLLIDADHFKHYNDIYGHQQGDSCLRAIAATIAATTRRPGDLPARYGGEEFAVVLPATPLQGACDVAEKLRRNIEALAREHGRNPCGIVTVSIGVAVAIPDREITPANLLETADEMLYRAKNAGRNRVAAQELRATPDLHDDAAPEPGSPSPIESTVTPPDISLRQAC